MNHDASSKDLRPEEYRTAINLVAVTDGAGASVRLENMLGMRQTSLTIGTAHCIGAWNYRETNKVYLFYYNSGASPPHQIVEYDGIKDTAEVLMSNVILNFSKDNPVNDCFVVGGLLYFNDGKVDGSGNGLRKINIEYAKTGALNSGVDERALSLIKTPPLHRVTANRAWDSNITLKKPKIRITPIQFSTRYVYDDDEISVIAPISDLVPAMDYDKDDSQYNMISTVVSIDTSLENIIKRVELLAREGNDGLWFVYDDFKPEDFTIAGTGKRMLEYDVYLDRSGAILSEQEAGQAAESVPRISSSLEIMEDRAFVVSTKEEYDVNLEDWAALVNLTTRSSGEAHLDANEYFPKFYKDDSYYKWGVVFMDDFGRKTAPAVRNNMQLQTEDILNVYGINKSYEYQLINQVDVNSWILYNHPKEVEAYARFSGKPPIWATKYQMARTDNLSYSDWFQAKFQVMVLYDTNPKTEEPTATQKAWGIFLDNGYYYVSMNQKLTDVLNGSGIGYYDHWDLVIPDGFPVGISVDSIMKMAFDYPARNVAQRRDKYSISQIENGRIRITGMDWFDWEIAFGRDKTPLTGFNMLQDQAPLDNEIAIHMEVLNPLPKTKTPLMYETGEIYDIANAGTESRAFQNINHYIEGDCYNAVYQDVNKEGVDNVDDSKHAYAMPKESYEYRTKRYQHSVSVLLQSPIADRKRAGNPVTYDDEGNPLPTNTESGLFNTTKHDSKGRATVEIPNQKELTRGTQVRFSRTFIQDSLVNGLSNFPEENKHAISADRGDIVKLVATNEKVLVAIHTRSITSLYINQKFINSGEGEAFLAQTDQVIGDDRKLLHNYGTQFPESVVTHDSRTYGFDGIMSEPWRRSQDGITPLAITFGMKTYFEKKGEQLRLVRSLDESASIQVLGGYDQWLDMYVLTFSEITYFNGVDTVTIPAETIGFSEKVKKWVSFYTFSPEYYTSIMNNLVSLKGGSIWRHMDTVERNLFYNQHENSSITISSNESNDQPKLYQNLGLSSNKRWKMSCITPEGKESILSLSNFIQRDSMFYAEFLRDKNTPQSNLKPNQTPLLHGEKMIGETMEITFTNEDSERVVLDAVYIGYSPMAGHLLSKQ